MTTATTLPDYTAMAVEADKLVIADMRNAARATQAGLWEVADGWGRVIMADAKYAATLWAKAAKGGAE